MDAKDEIEDGSASTDADRMTVAEYGRSLGFRMVTREEFEARGATVWFGRSAVEMAKAARRRATGDERRQDEPRS